MLSSRNGTSWDYNWTSPHRQGARLKPFVTLLGIPELSRLVEPLNQRIPFTNERGGRELFVQGTPAGLLSISSTILSGERFLCLNRAADESHPTFHDIIPVPTYKVSETNLSRNLLCDHCELAQILIMFGKFGSFASLVLLEQYFWLKGHVVMVI